MQIELIDTFLDLIGTRSFNRTAERLGVTQSTVSARLVALEGALGVRLFQRSRAGTDITTDGLKFEPHARLIRADWTRARRSVGAGGTEAMTLRLGLQNDLSAAWLGDIIADFRRALPETAFYVEPDYSAQMCSDIVSGHSDFAVVFTPQPHPDIAFTTVGEIPYRMIASAAGRLADVALDRYILANISPAFAATHRQLLPALSVASLSVGQSSAVAGLLLAIGGAGYVIEGAAAQMVASGRFARVADAPVIRQPVHTAVHLRDRMSTLHRTLVARVRARFAGSGARGF
jgi:DNA-binding transcriptional LysR family regulator